MTEDNEKRDKDGKEDGKTHPIERGTEEVLINGTQTDWVGLDITNVLVQLFHLLSCISRHTGCAVTLCHIECKCLCMQCLVSIYLSIIIGELHRRYLVLALMTRDHKDIIHHAAFNTISSELSIVCYLGIILIKVLGQIDDRLFDEFQVTCTTHRHTEGDGVISLHFFLINSG